jgi:DhnA family fructose-bisphosphate aldolase class Ia
MKSAPIPLLLAGGPASGDTAEVLNMVEKALNAGASGVCMGRQVFAHPDPGAMAKALLMMVHEGATAVSAMSAVGL